MKEQKISFLEHGRIKLEGLPDFYVHFVENFHLQERSLWVKFVNVFRQKADTADNGWRGEYWGKMMRGACLCYQYTQNEKLYEILRETVEDLLTVQEKNGRFSSYAIDSEFQGWDIWARKYVATGLFHFIDICPDGELNARIMKALYRHFDYILKKIGKTQGQKEITQTSNAWGATNSCTILEPTLEMYKRTGDKRYFDFAEYILSTGGSANGDLIKAATENKIAPCEYPVKKAYEVMSFFEGVLAYYELTKNVYYFKAVENFVEAVQKTEITIIGCAGMLGECFNYAVEKQTEEVEEPTQETCVTVTWMRLLARLYALTGDIKYIERSERSALNALYGSVNVYKQESYSKSVGGICGVLPFDSYSPVFEGQRNRGVGGLKELADGSYYGCCACIGAVAVALVPLTSVMRKGTEYYVNTYFTGRVDAEENFVFTMSGDYLSDGHWMLTIDKTDGKNKKIALRIPPWCKSFTAKHEGNGLKNGEGYYVVEREWAVGDTIELTLDMPLQRVDLNGYTAFTYGPLTLCRDNSKENCGDKVSEVAVDFSKDFAVIKQTTREGEMLRLQLKTEQGSILLTDYASCGKMWKNAENRISVWLKSKALTNI